MVLLVTNKLLTLPNANVKLVKVGSAHQTFNAPPRMLVGGSENHVAIEMAIHVVRMVYALVQVESQVLPQIRVLSLVRILALPQIRVLSLVRIRACH